MTSKSYGRVFYTSSAESFLTITVSCTAATDSRRD
jgi:hypothetical protein